MPFTCAAAQTTSLRGDIEANLTTHRKMMVDAIEAGADLLVFPELSLTGYEMDLAAELQFTPDAAPLRDLQALAKDAGMITVIGTPLRAENGKPYLGAVVLGGETITAYRKMHLPPSEQAYFQPGECHTVIEHKGKRIAFGICADLTHASHAEAAKRRGADMYAVGALVNKEDWPRDEKLLGGYARDHAITVVLANYASQSGPLVPVGNSSIWAPGGDLLTRSRERQERLITALI